MSGQTILIVDDETIILLELEMRLQQLGYLVAGKTMTGEEAIRLAETLRPDLILMDLNLGGDLGGIEAARTIVEKWAIPIVYITGASEKHLQQQLRQMQFSHQYAHIIKPFSEAQLQAAIQSLLPGHQWPG
jgi:CheY-like chemotaxis protein